MQKVVKAVFEEEVKKNCGDVRLCNAFVHRGMVCCQEGGDQPATIISLKGKILQIEPGESQPGLAKRGIENTTGCCHSRAGGWVGQQGGELEEVKFERGEASQGFHLCKPRDDAVSSGLDHSLLSVDLLLRWSLDKLFFVIPINVVGTNCSGQHLVTCSSDIVY